MNTVLLIALILVSVINFGVEGVDNGPVITGYLVTDGKCLDGTGIGIDTPPVLNEENLAANCIKLFIEVQDDKYVVKKADSQTDILKLAPDSELAYDSTGSFVQFSDGTSLVKPYDDKSLISDSDNPVIIQINGASATSAHCITSAPAYVEGTCGPVRWYVIEACEVDDCSVCNADVTMCDTCTTSSGKVPNAGSTACVCEDGKQEKTDGSGCAATTVSTTAVTAAKTSTTTAAATTAVDDARANTVPVLTLIGMALLTVIIQ